MSKQSAKRSKSIARLSPGVSATDCLPPELLEAICGFLDVRTLCTARLVCAQFRSSASRCIHSVEISAETLRSRPETTLSNFPSLRRVTLFDVKVADLLMLVQSPLADAVTHLRAKGYLRPLPRRTRNTPDLPLLPLPNLAYLTFSYAKGSAFLFPQTLRELSLGSWPVTCSTAETVAGLTNLTCLRIEICELRKPFQAVTALTALQRLEIHSDVAVVPFVAELTLLSHLDLRVADTAASLSNSASLTSLASLARLHRLVHLGVGYSGFWHESTHVLAILEPQVLASMSALTSLRSLDLVLCQRPDRSAFETVCMAPFSQLTALRLASFQLDASFLPRFSLERLQDLSLSLGIKLDAEGVAALRRATGLTELRLCTTTVGAGAGLEELGMTLPCMSRLRALSLGTPNKYQAKSLGTPDAAYATFSLKAIARLTELTRLSLSGHGVTANADGEVCLGLKKLRVLRMNVLEWIPAPPGCISRETFFAIAKLPELREFDIFGDVGVSEGDVTEDTRARLNAERHDKGWPPLVLKVDVPRRSHKP